MQPLPSVPKWQKHSSCRARYTLARHGSCLLPMASFCGGVVVAFFLYFTYILPCSNKRDLGTWPTNFRKASYDMPTLQIIEGQKVNQIHNRCSLYLHFPFFFCFFLFTETRCRTRSSPSFFSLPRKYPPSASFFFFGNRGGLLYTWR